jgi:hypothetical protein
VENSPIVADAGASTVPEAKVNPRRERTTLQPPES